MSDQLFSCKNCGFVNEDPDIQENEDWDQEFEERYRELEDICREINSEWEEKKKETKIVTEPGIFGYVFGGSRKEVPKYSSLKRYIMEEHPDISEELSGDLVIDKVYPSLEMMKKHVKKDKRYYFNCSFCGNKTYLPKDPEEEL